MHEGQMKNLGTIAMETGRRYDAEGDVLYLDLRRPTSGTSAEFDDEEIFVFRSLDGGDTVGFAIPHYAKYWQKNLQDLIFHLMKHAPGHATLIRLLAGSAQMSGPGPRGAQYSLSVPAMFHEDVSANLGDRGSHLLAKV